MSIIGFNGSYPYSVGQLIITDDLSFNLNMIYKQTLWLRIKGRSIVGVDETQGEYNTHGKVYFGSIYLCGVNIVDDEALFFKNETCLKN